MSYFRTEDSLDEPFSEHYFYPPADSMFYLKPRVPGPNKKMPPNAKCPGGGEEKQANKLKWQAIENYPWICQTLSGLAPHKHIQFSAFVYVRVWVYENAADRRAKRKFPSEKTAQMSRDWTGFNKRHTRDSTAARPEIWLFMNCLSRLL